MVSRQHLIVVLGLPGTGKTTFAAALANQLNAVHLNTDKIRALVGKRGKYNSDTKSVIYQLLFSKTEEALENNMHVIVDGTFSKDEWRKDLEAIALKTDCKLSWIMMEASEAIIRERVSKKRKYSEADFQVYQTVKASYDPLKHEHLRLRTDLLSMNDMIEQALDFINRPND